jgi:hypothetical protein
LGLGIPPHTFAGHRDKALTDECVGIGRR